MEIAEGAGEHPPTAMDLVRRRRRGEIDHEIFVTALKQWSFRPQYRVTSLTDDWEFVEDSLDTVLYAYSLDLLSEAEYEAISHLDDAEIATVVRQRRIMPSDRISDVDAHFGDELDSLEGNSPFSST